MTKIGIIAAGLLVASTAVASAHSYDIDGRQTWQLKKIEHGRQAGSITWREGLRLRAEQRRIRAYELAALSDGRLSKAEKRELRQMQNAAGRNIAEAKHNFRRRVSWLPRFGR